MRGSKLQLTLLACCAACLAVAREKEPTYNGRSLSEWTAEIDPHGGYIVSHPPPYVVAIEHMGTNALPLLLKWMSEKDPPVVPKPHLAPCFNMTRSEQAAAALGILGETARPAIPQLTKLAMTLTDRDRYDRCIEVLADIGPDSLPSFITILTKGTTGRRFSAIENLAVFQTNAVVALPAVINCLVGRNEELGWKAADELSRLKIPSTTVVPALTNALPTASAPARARILRCLYWLDAPAREAVPAIRAALSDPNREVRTNALYAAQRIAPELLIHPAPK
jgi:HEAT repeat protein